METLTTAVLARVRSLVRDEELAGLSVSTPAARAIAVELTVRHAVAFDVDYATEAGALPQDAERLAGGASLEATAEQRLRAALHAAPGLLRQWASGHAD